MRIVKVIGYCNRRDRDSGLRWGSDASTVERFLSRRSYMEVVRIGEVIKKLRS
jgi:hypothetical protein